MATKRKLPPPKETWYVRKIIGEYCVDLKDALKMQRLINRRIRRENSSRLALSFRGVKALTPAFTEVMLVGLNSRLSNKHIIKKLVIVGENPEHIVYFAKQAMKKIASAASSDQI